jgi:hypothetical protein
LQDGFPKWSATCIAAAFCFAKASQNQPCVALAKQGGDPGVIRTRDPRFRKPVLYPAELRDHWASLYWGLAAKGKACPIGVIWY